MKHRILIIAILGFTLIYPCAAQEKPVWKGKIEFKDGVEIIKNPKEPQYEKKIVHFMEDFRLVTNDELDKGIAVISGIEVDKSGDMFVLDSKESCIHVLDINGNPKKVIGAKGQGPGEFENPRYIFISPNSELFVWDTKRISVFSAGGHYLRGYPSSILNAIERCVIDRDNNIFGVRCSLMKKPITRELAKFDSKFKLIKIFEIYEIPPIQNKTFDPFKPMSMDLGLNKAGLVIVATQDRYEMRLYDSNGDLKKRILRDYDKRPVTKRDKEEILKGIPKDLPVRFKFSDSFPAWKNIFCGDRDHIFVETHEKSKDGRDYIYDIYDARGHYIARTPITNGTVLLFKDDHVYLRDVNEAGYHIFKRMRMIWTLQD